MDRRSWPWKKKSSDKHDKEAYSEASAGGFLTANSSQKDKDNYKKPNNVQISIETYNHLTGLEEQVKTSEEQIHLLEDDIKELHEKLSAAHTDINSKDELVKQHAKVAEEAVSGWEKAEAEALALKNHLESVTLLKLTAENRATQLDDALKECMKQIRNLKEEHEQKIQDVVFTKNKQFDKMKHELEARIANLDQDILRAAAENAAISRSLQERSNMLVKISEEKSQAETRIEILNSNIESCEKEINSLKYELHIASKELEIRTEEKNMSMRSADVANRQHTEAVKKIAKLEAECQRLRGLVRKKLPGPAALAQMKLEVESLGRDYVDTRGRRESVRSSNSHYSSLPEYALDGLHKVHKESDFLTERILAMEEETKMLKEALANRNSELLASRNLCAKAESRLLYLETQLETDSLHKSYPRSLSVEGFLAQNINSPSHASLSEDGNDDSRSFASSTLKSLASKAENVKHLELMDDFLEMEKLAHMNEKMPSPSLDNSENKVESVSGDVAVDTYSVVNAHLEADISQPSMMEFRSKLCLLIESASRDADKASVLDIVKCILQDACLKASERSAELPKEMVSAVQRIHEFVQCLGKDAMQCDRADFNHTVEKFSSAVDSLLAGNLSFVDFVSDLSHVLAEASDLRISFLGFKGGEQDVSSPDCIDKIALPENKGPQKEPSLNDQYDNSQILIPTSAPVFPDDENLGSNMSPMEFEEWKSEKENMARDLARVSQDLEATKTQLRETEQQLAELRAQQEAAADAKSLSETQLKCMVESYRSLEARSLELEAEVNELRARLTVSENDLQTEKDRHQETIIKFNDLEDLLQKSNSSSSDADLKTKQDRELAAAAEKLAECQETILMLGKQLKSLHPQHNFLGSPTKAQNGDASQELLATCAEVNSQSEDDPADANAAGSADSGVAPRSPEVDSCVTPPMLSPMNSRHSTGQSGTSSSSSTPTPEKHSRGFTRFFSSKGKNGY